MIIYHGSENKIERPVFGYGSRKNDFGLGFYCTEDFGMACEWAVKNGRNGFANMYELDLAGLKILNLTENYSTLEWISVLLQNRIVDEISDFGKEAILYLKQNCMVPYWDYDVIIGYRADDSYFSFAQVFINNTISLSTLKRAMNLGKLGTQVVLVSEKAFEHLTYIDYKVASAREWYELRQNRDSQARTQYKNMRHEPWKKGEIYMMQILEEEIRPDDPRVR